MCFHGESGTNGVVRIMYVVCLVLGSIDVFHSVQTSFRLQLLSRAFALPYVPRIRM